MAHKPRVLLVHPPIYDFTAFDLFLYPLGILEAAAAFEAAGFEARVVDALDRWFPLAGKERGPAAGGSGQADPASLKPPTFRKNGTGRFLRQRISKPPALSDVPRHFYRFGIPRDALKNAMARAGRPDLVAVGCTMTYWYLGVRETAALARELFEGVPVVLGGLYATLCREHALAETGVDAVLPGPAAAVLPAFLSGAAGPPDGAGVAKEPTSQRPAHHLLGRRDSAALRASLGCPHHCIYCAARDLDGPRRVRPREDVAGEVAFLVEKQGRRHVAFHDDALVARREEGSRAATGEDFLELAEVLRGKGLHEKAAFYSINGLDASAVSEDVARALRKTNFASLRLGFETADENLQKATGFKSSRDDLKAALAALYCAGYRARDIGVYVLAGLPGQDPATIADTIRFVHDSGALVRITEFAPVPGTPAFGLASRLSRLDLAEPLNHNKSLAAFRFNTLTPGRLRELKDLALECNMRLLEGRS